MRNTSLVITVPHSLSTISALNSKSRPYIITLHFKFHEALQINQPNFIISINTFIKE